MERVRVDTFPAGSVLMNELMPVLLQGANESPTVLGQSLFQVNLYTTLSKQCMITMLYHRKLDDEWRAAAEALRLKLAQVPTLQGTGFVPHIIGRARKQRVDVAANRITETVTVEGGKEFRYVQVEETFTQPNAAVCQHMLSWARKVRRFDRGSIQFYPFRSGGVWDCLYCALLPVCLRFLGGLCSRSLTWAAIASLVNG